MPNKNEIKEMPGLEESRFNVSEIFYSIQGEGTRAGMPCVFVRLQGCMLRCSWCDTPYALEIRQKELDLGADDIISRIESYGCGFVEFTGGEPLQQKENLLPLMSHLCDKGYTVAVETNGHVDTSDLDSRVIRIIDMKCPTSKMTKFNNYHNLEILTDKDEVKFVIGSREDYDWARQKLFEYDIHRHAGAVLFSPAFSMIEPVRLAEWVLEDRLPVRMQLQMHKFIWSPDTRGV